MATYHFSNRPHATLKSGQKMNVQTHYEYICREGKYSHMRDRSAEKLTAVSCGNMPIWAYNSETGTIDARKFWKEDETHRDANARGYREIRMALMEEFTDEENVELVETFLKRSGIKDNHAYSYAVHDKVAAFDSNHRNIHAHIMFNEKIIEQERPLSAEQYFKKYSVKKDLTPVGGYKVSRYYSSREATIRMRQLWEDVVNEKMKEKGLDTRVSCKSLKDQKEEAEENLDYLKASLLDRKSAPNLGSLYRRPERMEHIQELVQSFTEATYDSLKEQQLEETIQHLEDDEQERSMILFAQDQALRNLARQIREEEKKELEEARNRALRMLEQQEQEQRKEELNTAPWVINGQDIITYIQEEKQKLKEETEILYRKYHMLFTPTMTQEKAKQLALNSMTNGRYERLRHEYEKAKETYDTNVALEDSFLKDRTAGAAERYGNYLTQRNKLKDELSKKENDFRTIENYLQEDGRKEVIEQIAERIYKENQTKHNENVATFKQVIENQNRQLIYDKHIADLKSKKLSVYVQATMLPRTVTRKESLYGAIPIRTLPVIVTNNTQYILLDSDDLSNKSKARAIKFNDTTKEGSAKVYELQLREDEVTRRKRIESVTETNAKIPLYQSYSSFIQEIEKAPKETTEELYKKLKEMREAVEKEYQKLYPATAKSRTEEKAREVAIRNKDPDISM